MNEDQSWREVPVTFGELSDILGSMHIGVNGSVGYTGYQWRESIKQMAKDKLEEQK